MSNPETTSYLDVAKAWLLEEEEDHEEALFEQQLVMGLCQEIERLRSALATLVNALDSGVPPKFQMRGSRVSSARRKATDILNAAAMENQHE